MFFPLSPVHLCFPLLLCVCVCGWVRLSATPHLPDYPRLSPIKLISLCIYIYSISQVSRHPMPDCFTCYSGTNSLAAQFISLYFLVLCFPPVLDFCSSCAEISRTTCQPKLHHMHRQFSAFLHHSAVLPAPHLPSPLPSTTSSIKSPLPASVSAIRSKTPKRHTNKTTMLG